jgi:hypothetical protein
MIRQPNQERTVLVDSRHQAEPLMCLLNTSHQELPLLSRVVHLLSHGFLLASIQVPVPPGAEPGQPPRKQYEYDRWPRNVRKTATGHTLAGAVSPGEEVPMNDDRVLRVLEEMRDLQRQSTANYQEALRNQQESIRLQQTGLRRVRLILGLAGFVLFLAVGMLLMLLFRVMGRLQCISA